VFLCPGNELKQSRIVYFGEPILTMIFVLWTREYGLNGAVCYTT